MEKKIPSPPRLSIEISPEQDQALNQLIPWGVKGQLFRVLIDDMIMMLRKNPDATLGAILSKTLTIKDFPSLKKGE